MDFYSAKETLLSAEANISEKMRALFTLRNIESDESALQVAKAFKDRSVLLKHEVAYVLGQMGRECSVRTLLSVLEDELEDEIVRHEAAEALGNYQDVSLIGFLQRYFGHSSAPLRETCALAAKKIATGRGRVYSPFISVDPAYPAGHTVEEAERVFLSEGHDLYERYAAMFFLRNLMTAGAVEALCKGFGDSSVLFRHEIAFVLGQMQMEEATECLIRVLNDDSEHEMVKHECAEALGAIGTERAKQGILPFLESAVTIIRESAEVALDIHECRNGGRVEFSSS